MLWCSLVGVDRPPNQAMPVAIACLEQEDLGFGVLCSERKVIRAEKVADGRVPLPARSGYISENRGTILGKVDVAGYIPPFFGHDRVKAGVDQSALCPFHAVNKQDPLLCRFLTRVYPVVSFVHHSCNTNEYQRIQDEQT